MDRGKKWRKLSLKYTTNPRFDSWVINHQRLKLYLTKLSNLLTILFKHFEDSRPSNPNINKDSTMTNAEQEGTSSTSKVPGCAGGRGGDMSGYSSVSWLKGLSYCCSAYRSKLPRNLLKWSDIYTNYLTIRQRDQYCSSYSHTYSTYYNLNYNECQQFAQI